MRAVTIPRFGGAEVLEYTEAEAPVPGPGQVAIDVTHAGVNYAEILFRQGAVDVPLPYVPGIEAAGRIRALGDGVSGLRVGQSVTALTMTMGGGYGAVAVTDAHLVAPLPDDADRALMAAVPSNSTTAWLVLGEVARLRKGERVLVHAAAGGAGSQLGQVARLLGAGQVVGTVGSPDKIEAATAFGYDKVVLRDDLPGAVAGLTDGRGFDVAVDPVGGAARRASLDALAQGGRLVAMGNASGADDVPFSANELWFSGKGVLGFNLGALSGERPEAVSSVLRQAVGAVLDGELRVDVGQVLPLRDATEAHRRLESGRTTGKLVLAMEQE
ncbi:zinc-binding dehydrogenase [Streptomyces sp. Rer75]|uniref:quinone oxidoreductase family protein n=1 Tax=unclassified Streptomyces TaxID=2593676 RepID=UPI0015CFD117|nr:zinc-binding dehydrogenase [Streptomyces sp. Rer75]QLH25758.1 zinc-binding dehydrogenase [Streptomyces sp. Rer75]